MARVEAYLSTAELEARFCAASTTTEARHFQTIWLLAQGRTISEVAAVVSFVPRWVEELLQRYNAEGPQALGDLRRHNRRAPGVLTPDVLAALAERVQRPPDGGGLWTGPKVAAWIAVYLGREHVHPQRGWDALKRIRWSIQMPRPLHPAAATPEEQEVFKKNLQPRSRKSPRQPRGARSKSGPPTSTASV